MVIWKGEFYRRIGKGDGRPSWRNRRTGEVRGAPPTANRKAISRSNLLGYEPTNMHNFGAHVVTHTKPTNQLKSILLKRK